MRLLIISLFPILLFGQTRSNFDSVYADKVVSDSVRSLQTLTLGKTVGVEGNTLSFLAANNRTDATQKNGSYGVLHYTNSEEPLSLIRGQAAVSTNNVQIGGGTSLMNAATSIFFYGATNNTTTTGTVRSILDHVNDRPRLTIGTTAGTGAGRLYLDSIFIATTLIVDALRNAFFAKITSDSSFTINERSTTPTLPTSNTQIHYYMKGDKIIWVINAGGTPRYYYFDATATADQQIKYSATEP